MYICKHRRPTFRYWYQYQTTFKGKYISWWYINPLIVMLKQHQYKLTNEAQYDHVRIISDILHIRWRTYTPRQVTLDAMHVLPWKIIPEGYGLCNQCKSHTRFNLFGIGYRVDPIEYAYVYVFWLQYYLLRNKGMHQLISFRAASRALGQLYVVDRRPFLVDSVLCRRGW